MLAARAVEKLRLRAVVSRVIRGQVARPHALPLDTHAAEREIAVRHVVERAVVAILDGLRRIADQAPRPLLPIGPDAVERLAHVRAVAHRYEALQVERHLLAADPRLERAGADRVDVGDERLTQIDAIAIDGADVVLAERARVLELHERLHVPGDAQVRMHLHALQHVGIAARAAEAEERRVVDLEPLAQPRAERQIRIDAAEERHVLERVERPARHARVRERRPVFLPAVEQDRGACLRA